MGVILIKENKNFKKGSHIKGQYKYVEPNTIGVYFIYHDETKEFYVGSSNDINTRISHHFGSLKRNSHDCYRLQKLYNSSEYSDFSFNYIKCETLDYARKLELEILHENHNNDKLLNTSTLNNNWINDRNCHLKKSMSEKLSQISKKRIGELNPFFNKTHTQETKDKIAKSRLGSINEKDSIPCVIDGKYFRSFTEASEKLNIPLATVHHRIYSVNKLYVNWYIYKDTKKIIDSRLLDIDKNNITCLFKINNKYYYNYKDILNDFNIKSSTTILNRCKSKSINFKDWEKLL